MHVTIEIEAELAAVVTELAAQMGRPPEWVIAKAIEIYVAEHESRTPPQGGGVEN